MVEVKESMGRVYKLTKDHWPLFTLLGGEKQVYNGRRVTLFPPILKSFSETLLSRDFVQALALLQILFHTSNFPTALHSSKIYSGILVGKNEGEQKFWIVRMKFIKSYLESPRKSFAQSLTVRCISSSDYSKIAELYVLQRN